jgi:hypothetical protein
MLGQILGLERLQVDGDALGAQFAGLSLERLGQLLSATCSGKVNIIILLRVCLIHIDGICN